jgi:hypothetical protein
LKATTRPHQPETRKSEAPNAASFANDAMGERFGKQFLPGKALSHFPNRSETCEMKAIHFSGGG